MANELIKKFESFRADPYLDAVDIPTIGYGTIIYPAGNKVTMNDRPVTEQYAAMLLDQHLNKHVRPALKEYVTVPLNSNQREALESLLYNIGVGAFRSSTLRRKLNLQDYHGAAAEFTNWSYAKRKFLKGLLIRRTQELILFMTPAYKGGNELKEKPLESEGVFVKVLAALVALFKKTG